MKAGADEDDDEIQEALLRKRDLFKFLASLEPLCEEDAMPEIDDPPPEPVTCFDDWINEEEEVKDSGQLPETSK